MTIRWLLKLENGSLKFEMNDMGGKFLAWSQSSEDKSKRLICSSQETYIKNVLECFIMQDAKPIIWLSREDVI